MPAWGDVNLQFCFLNFVRQRGTVTRFEHPSRHKHKRCTPFEMTRIRTKVWIWTLGLFCMGCSWEIFPLIRNFTNETIQLKVLALESEKRLINKMVVLSCDSIYSIEHETIMSFTDTLRGKYTGSDTWTVEIRPKSTAIVHLPYGWRSDHYIITAERQSGLLDTLNRTLNFSVIRKDKKFARYPRAFTDDRIYFDFK